MEPQLQLECVYRLEKQKQVDLLVEEPRESRGDGFCENTHLVCQEKRKCTGKVGRRDVYSREMR